MVSSEVQNDNKELVKNLKIAFVETWFDVKIESKPSSPALGFHLAMEARLLVSEAIMIETLIMTIG